MTRKKKSSGKRAAKKTDARSVRARPGRRANDVPVAASPAAAGPAGSLLEGHVGAQYLLPLLSEGEARGLPGVKVTRVAFQRASYNHPMDDVIVTGHDPQGRAAALELQAKRTIDFTAGDRVFADVVAFACRAAAKPSFDATRYQLAVAIARTSTKIEQHIQDVLKWAREYQNPDSFFHRLKQPGATHVAKRDFVAAFRGHMRAAGSASDDAAVWRLLRRFQVLAFDFEQPGSACEQLARERCVLQLAPQDVARAGELWDSLQQIALQLDAAGGDVDADTLRERLSSERSYRLASNRRLHDARNRLSEMADGALETINVNVRGIEIDRTDRVAAALASLELGRYLEIRGAGGVGKSGVLRDLARRIAAESRVIVVAPHRVPAGGWMALAAQLGGEVSAHEFLTDLAGDGGATLFVDGIDRFEEPGQRATIVDLIRAAAQVRGFRVVVTARLDFDDDARAWLPVQALRDLGEAPPIVIDELSDDEVTWLQSADPALAALLQPGHPAAKVVRNLYRLDRLVRGAVPESVAPFSEAQMAAQWWTTGDGRDVAGRVDRRRALRLLAEHSLVSSAPMAAATVSAQAITALVESGSLRLSDSVRVELVHDVLRDWAIGNLLYEDPAQLQAIALDSRAPVRLVRGVEIAARLHAELGSDATAWRALLDQLSIPGAHGSWRRAALLALARSERADDALNRCLPALAADGAMLLSELVRAAIAVDSQPAAPLWAAMGVDTSKLSADFVWPLGAAWLNLIFWSLDLGDRLPPESVPQFVDLYNRWCSALGARDALSPRLVRRLHTWLVAVEEKNHPRVDGFAQWMAAKEASGLSMTDAQENDLRTAFLMWCKLCPAETASYLQALTAHPYRHILFRKILPFIGTAAYAAPQATAELFMQSLTEGDREDLARQSRMRDSFSHWDLQYFPASPTRAPFLDLLQADKEHGLKLVRDVVAHAVRRGSRNREPGENRIVIPFPGAPRSFFWRQTYSWSRDQGSHVVASALMALEAWSHLRIERGEAIETVIDDILGIDETAVTAYLLVAIDVMLSHWPKSKDHLWPFAASGDLLALDHQRFEYDVMYGNQSLTGWVHPEPAGAVRLENLKNRPSRRLALEAVLAHYGMHSSTEVREAMRQALKADATRLGLPDSYSEGFADPKFAAMSAMNQLDPANYVPRGSNEHGESIVEYVLPAEEFRLLSEFQKKAQDSAAEVVFRNSLMRALTERQCSAELLEKGVRWATNEASAPQIGADKDEQEWIERTRVIVAALSMRDGSPELKIAQGTWARGQLVQAAISEPDDSGFPKELQFNLAAIAAVGLLAAYRDTSDVADLTSLLHVASKPHTRMASVLRVEMAAQRPLRPELLRSLVRLGIASSIYALRDLHDDPFDSAESYRARMQAREIARKQAEQTRLENAVAAELRWLVDGQVEPNWPTLPDPRPARGRRGIVVGEPKQRRKRAIVRSSEYALGASTAGQWLSLAVEVWRVDHSDLLCSLVRHCWSWTAGANGVGCGRDEESREHPYEWNTAYFAAALAAAVSTSDSRLNELVFERVAELSDERLFDAVEAILHALDQLWLSSGVVSDSVALVVRETLAQRLVSTWAWRRLVSERSRGVEVHLAGALAAMFLGQNRMGQGPRCYLLRPGAARLHTVLPLLTELAEQTAGSTFVALAFLSVLEVEPHADRLVFMSRAVAAWWEKQGPSSEFWIDYAIGQRVCEWIEKAVLSQLASKDVLESSDLALMVDILLRCGTPLAKALEECLVAHRDAGAL